MNNPNPIVSFDAFGLNSQNMLRVRGSKGWANYKYCAPFDALSRPTKGRCLHSVIVDKNTPIDDHYQFTQMTIGSELFTVIHFEAAGAALDAVIEIAGVIEDQALWVDNGFICSQKAIKEAS